MASCVECKQAVSADPCFYCGSCQADLGLKKTDAAPIQSRCNRCAIETSVAYYGDPICTNCSWMNKVNWEYINAEYGGAPFILSSLSADSITVLGQQIEIRPESAILAQLARSGGSINAVQANLSTKPTFTDLLQTCKAFNKYMIVASPIPVNIPHTAQRTRIEWQQASMQIQNFFNGAYVIQSSTPFVDPLSVTFNCFLTPPPPTVIPTTFVAMIKSIYGVPRSEVNGWLRLHESGTLDMRKLLIHVDASPIGGNVVVPSPPTEAICPNCQNLFSANALYEAEFPPLMTDEEEREIFDIASPSFSSDGEHSSACECIHCDIYSS